MSNILKSQTEVQIKTKSGKLKYVKLTKSKAIKCYCTQCMGWETNPKDCEITECPLYLYRGKTLLTND